MQVDREIHYRWKQRNKPGLDLLRRCQYCEEKSSWPRRSVWLHTHGRHPQKAAKVEISRVLARVWRRSRVCVRPRPCQPRSSGWAEGIARANSRRCVCARYSKTPRAQKVPPRCVGRALHTTSRSVRENNNQRIEGNGRERHRGGDGDANPISERAEVLVADCCWERALSTIAVAGESVVSLRSYAVA